MNSIATQQRVYGDLDSELPSVAALAAAEIDDLTRGETSDLKNLKMLSEILSTTFESSEGEYNGTFQLLDPVGTSIITQSIADFQGVRLHTYDELKKASAALVQEMKKIERKNTELVDRNAILLRLKEFCLSLSRYALASKDKIDSFWGTPEYQR